MKRTEFLKGIGLAGLTVSSLTILTSCSKDSSSNTIEEESGTNTDTSIDATNGDCEETPNETAGPFPTKDPDSLEREDITGDRSGINLDIDLTIRNVNDDCNILAGAVVDIWHCDKDGNYSEYGGTGMQSTDYSRSHFLRGRQTSNESGVVKFTSIFPGWYNGRSTHIHVHIYNQNGSSLLVTQIAFPEGENSAVIRVNNATDYGYTKGMSGYTYTAQDNVFSDGVEEELASVSGSVSEGFVLTHNIYVKG